MNYFAHALPFLEGDPYFVAGTAVPDWMSVADRPVRVREKLAVPVIAASTCHLTTAVGSGAIQHLRDDDWFHRTQGFTEVTSQLAGLFRSALPTDESPRCGFLGHIVTELLLDDCLIAKFPGLLDRYYELLAGVDAVRIESVVNQIARGKTDRLQRFIPLFLRERFLYDYADNVRLLHRLNAVLNRVKLSVLPTSISDLLSEMRMIVQRRTFDLLPPQLYAWPT